MKKYFPKNKWQFIKLPFSDVLEKHNLAGLRRAVRLVGDVVEVQLDAHWSLDAPKIDVSPVDVGFHSENSKWFFYDSGEEATGVFCFWEWDAKSKKYQLIEAFGVDMDGRPVSETKHASDDRDCTFDWMHDKTPLGEDEDDYDVTDKMGRAVTSWNIETGVSLIKWTPPKRESWMGHDLVKFIKKNYMSVLHDGHSLSSGTVEEAGRIMGF